MDHERSHGPQESGEPKGAQRSQRRTDVGVVTSDKMDKTRRVEVTRRVKHPQYGKYVRRRTVCYAHDENNVSHKGDTVEIMETRPLSKTKCWRLLRIVTKDPTHPPQGLTEQQFVELSRKVRAKAGPLGTDIRAHGSRVSGTAQPDSDLDIAILVSEERFEEILQERFKTPKPDSAKEKTMQNARFTGKIQSGEAGLRGLRRELERDLSTEVDISVIRVGSQFDQGPYIPLRNA